MSETVGQDKSVSQVKVEKDISEMSDKDPVLKYIGNFGKWQARTISIVSMIGLIQGWHFLCISFIMPTDVSHWCVSPQYPFSHDSASWISPPKIDPNTGIPMLDDNNETVWDMCRMYVMDYKEMTNETNLASLNTTSCSKWEYDKNQYAQTVISQFNLVCENKYQKSLSDSIYMFGLLVGVLISGILSDKYGRRRILLLFSCGFLAFAVASSFSSSLLMFNILRCCVAFFGFGSYCCGYVYCVEIVGGKWSTIVGIGYQLPYALSYITMPLVAWIYPAWNDLLLYTAIPFVVYIILVALPFLVPESPRWMLFNGKYEQAIDLLTTASSLNQRTIQLSSTKDDATSEKNTPHRPSASFLDLFRSKRLCINTLIIYYLWFSINLVYHGFTLNPGSLIPGDLHINFLISGALEMLGTFITIFVLLCFGRRWTLSIAMILGGSMFLIMPLLPSVTSKAICAQIGKFLVTCCSNLIYVYAAEIFPTVVRGTGIGSSNVFAMLGGILSPLIGRELGSVSKEAPIITFGFLSLLAGFLTLLLPETKNRKPPDTIEEAEQFDKNQSLMPRCW